MSGMFTNATDGPDVIWTNFHVACALWFDCSDVTHRNGGHQQLLLCCFFTNIRELQYFRFELIWAINVSSEKKKNKKNRMWCHPRILGGQAHLRRPCTWESVSGKPTTPAHVWMAVYDKIIPRLSLVAHIVNWVSILSHVIVAQYCTPTECSIILHYSVFFSWGNSAYGAIFDFIHTRILSNLGISMKDLDFERFLDLDSITWFGRMFAARTCRFHSLTAVHMWLSVGMDIRTPSKCHIPLITNHILLERTSMTIDWYSSHVYESLLWLQLSMTYKCRLVG